MLNYLIKRWEEREERDYWRTGVIASTIANVNRDTKKKPKPFKVEDFMPRKRKRKKPMYTDEQLRAIERINKLLGISADYLGAKRGRDR